MTNGSRELHLLLVRSDNVPLLGSLNVTQAVWLPSALLRRTRKHHSPDRRIPGGGGGDASSKYVLLLSRLAGAPPGAPQPKKPPKSTFRKFSLAGGHLAT